MENIKKLYIPRGLKLRSEIFNGFGKEELIKSIISSIVFGIIDIIIYIITKKPRKSKRGFLILFAIKNLPKILFYVIF